MGIIGCQGMELQGCITMYAKILQKCDTFLDFVKTEGNQRKNIDPMYHGADGEW